MVGVLSEMSVGLTPDGGALVLSIHLECGLLGFVIGPELADALAKELTDKAMAARTGFVLPPTNGVMRHHDD